MGYFWFDYLYKFLFDAIGVYCEGCLSAFSLVEFLTTKMTIEASKSKLLKYAWGFPIRLKISTSQTENIAMAPKLVLGLIILETFRRPSGDQRIRYTRFLGELLIFQCYFPCFLLFSFCCLRIKHACL